MKAVFEVKSVNRLNHLNPNDILIYDGKTWYVTTKEDLFKKEVAYLEECKKSLNEVKQEVIDFKKDVAGQIKEISETTAQILGGMKNE